MIFRKCTQALSVIKFDRVSGKNKGLSSSLYWKHYKLNLLPLMCMVLRKQEQEQLQYTTLEKYLQTILQSLPVLDML
jgi:hypothetical protein